MDNVALLEGRHMIEILLYLEEHGPCNKYDVRLAMNGDPRTAEKLDLLEDRGLVVQTHNRRESALRVSLTPNGVQVAGILREIDGLMRAP